MLPDLPPKTSEILRLELSRQERGLYEGLRREALTELQGAALTREGVLRHLRRLCQFCCHPGLVFPQLDHLGARLEFALNLLDELQSQGHRCLVFSFFPSVLKRLAQALEVRGIAHE